MAKRAQTKGLFGAGIRRICAVAAASTAAEMADLVRKGLRETPTIELRLDWLRDDSERARFLVWAGKNKPRNATFLATCRRRAGGGKLAGGIRSELHWLNQAREVGCSWCDLEVETARALPSKALKELGLPAHTLLSLHDFKRMPSQLRSFSSAAHAEAEAVKIAVHAETYSDSVRLLNLTRR